MTTPTSMMASDGKLSRYTLDPSQTLRAAQALIKKIRSELENYSKPRDLLADAEDSSPTPIWLLVTTKKHVASKSHLKPSKIALPHPLPVPQTSEGEIMQKICLITTDPQRYYKDLIAHDTFPSDIRGRMGRVIGLTKLKSKYKTFESRRQLFSEYDMFLADDRVVTYLPKLLGKVFYGTGMKRPIPVNLQGKRLDIDEKGEKRVALAKGGNKSVRIAPNAEIVGRELQRAADCAVVALSPGTNVSIKIGTSEMSAESVRANIEATMAALTDKHIPKGWRNVRAVYIKGPKTQSLPVWMADELWTAEEDVLEDRLVAIKGKDASATDAVNLATSNDASIVISGQSSKKRRSRGNAEEDRAQKEERIARKKARKDQMAGVQARYRSSTDKDTAKEIEV